MPTGQTRRHHADVVPHQEAEVEVPVTQYRKMLVEVTDGFVDAAPVEKGDGWKTVFAGDIRQSEHVAGGKIRAPPFDDAPMDIDLFEDPHGVGHDPLHGVIGITRFQEGHACRQKSRIPGVVVVVNRDVFAGRGANRLIGGVLHARGLRIVEDLEAPPVGSRIFRGQQIDRYGVTAVIDDHMRPVCIGLSEDRFHGAAQHQRAAPCPGDYSHAPARFRLAGQVFVKGSHTELNEASQACQIEVPSSRFLDVAVVIG